MNMKRNKLLQYILPSVGGLCVTYLYNIVDGIFVGQGVGANALAAVNITVPFITALIAISTLFAMGGSTIIAIRLGANDKEGANDAFMNSLVTTIILAIILLFIGTVFPTQISKLCGSSHTLAPLASEYLFFYTAFSIPFLLSNCLSIFVRNDGAPGISFLGMCVGAVINIFLDWLFIFPLQMGLKGAAIASGLGQVFSCIILLSHFVMKKGQLRIQKYQVNINLVGEIFKRGVPECISQLNTPVTALCYNWVLTSTLGDMGIATFSVLSFIYSLANAVLSGVAQGLQPLWGQAYGMERNDVVHDYLKSGIKINMISSIIIYIILFIFRNQAVALFNSDPALIQMAGDALPIFSLSFLCMSVNLIFTAYFYSIKQTGKANIIAMSRGIVVKALAIFLIPYLLGNTFIWSAAFVAEGVTCIVSIVCIKIN